MKDSRAKRIATNFSASASFRVRPFNHGLLVQYHQNTCYFVRESCFWDFIYKMAGLDESVMH
ncbi:MAG TPA: hypothetical protein VKA31_04460 [Mariprofundaceae bacterium]|nr:hypothetical protein [Mariprofundaceae bacterium]